MPKIIETITTFHKTDDGNKEVDSITEQIIDVCQDMADYLLEVGEYWRNDYTLIEWRIVKTC